MSDSNIDGQLLPVLPAVNGSASSVNQQQVSINIPLSGPNANAARAVINAEKTVKGMTASEMSTYLLDNGSKIADNAFTKVKDDFLGKVINSVKNEERGKLNGYTTILQVQEAEQKMKEDIALEQKRFENAKVNDPNATKQKGHAEVELGFKKQRASRLQPVHDVLKSKFKAANTLTTVQPLFDSYMKLEGDKGKNDPEVKRQAVVLSTAYKQYAREIKEVLDGALAILPNDEELKKNLDDITLIINEMEKEASPVSVLNSNMKTPLLNRTKKDGPIDVSVLTKDGSTMSYRLDKGNFSKLDTVIRDEDIVETKFKEAVQSAKEGTKVVKMTYKGEPLIVSLNISHPNESKEKAKQNMNNALKKEAERIVPSEEIKNGMEQPGKTQNLKKLSLEQLRSAQQQIEKEIAFVNSNTKVLPANKNTLKTAMRESRVVPIQREIAQRHLNNPSKGGRKTKRNHSKKGTRKQTTRRSS